MPHRRNEVLGDPGLPQSLPRRRVIVGGLLGLGTIALLGNGCDAATEPTGNGAPRQEVTPTAKSVDVDSDLVDRMTREIAAAAAVVAAVRRAAPSLRRVAKDLQRLHAAHLDELGWSGRPPQVPAVSRERAADRLGRAEADLRAALTDGCIEAHSGALAQLLAAMAAAIAQRQVALT